MKKLILPASIGSGIGVLVISLVILGVTISNKSNSEYPSLKFTIVGTNDLHGKYYPSLLSRSDTLEKYGYGGLEVMASIIEILKKQNPNYFLYLDAGDQFQGAFESSKQISSGQIITDYFNHISLSSSAVGNHQFDFGQQFLRSYLSKLRNNILSANLIDSNFQKSQSQRFPLLRQQPSTIHSFSISEDFKDLTILNEIKIGVIGLATIETLYTTSGFTDKLFPSSYKFQKYSSVLTSQATKLRQQGAHAVILVSHIGNQCGRNTTFGIWTSRNMGNFDECNKNDQIFGLIDSLPENTIDAIIQGHRHSTSHFFYKGIPIMGNVNDGNYLNVMYLNFKVKEDKLIVDKDSFTIQGPIPICQKIFEYTKKCEYVKASDLQQAGRLKNWDFHGIKVQKDKELALITQSKWAAIMQQYEIEIAPNFIQYPLEKIYTVKNPFGNLITNLLASYMIKKPYNFHFIILNAGSFRSAWYPGIIRYAELISMFPFQNKLSFFDIKGSDLKLLIRNIQSGRKAYYPSYGLSQIFQKNALNTTLNLISLVLADGSPIIDNQIYTGVTNDFLVQGGDDFNGQTGFFSNVVIRNELIRNIVRQELELRAQINEQSLSDPTNLERLVILN